MRTYALSLAFCCLPQLAFGGVGPVGVGAEASPAQAEPTPALDGPAAQPDAVAPSADEPLSDDSQDSSSKEYGPFYEEAPASEVQFPTAPKRPGQPVMAVGGNAFCFVEDSACNAALLADFDFGVGMNVVGSDRGIDVPYTQWRVRGGFTLRPLQIARGGFHPWGVGLTVGYSQGSAQIATGRGSSADPFAEVEELNTLEGLRIAMVHQLWLSQKRNALHADLSFGTVRSTVFDANGRFWGTHAELAVGWGGWATFFGSADFLDRDLRAVFGFRTHAVAAGPVVGRFLLGLLAGGAL